MSRRIFFGRHGYTHNGSVTAHGMQQLLVLRNRLEELNFHSTFAITSGQERSNQTASFLSYGCEPIVVSELHAYGDLKEVGIATGETTRPRWLSASEYAVEALDAVLLVAPDDGDIAVIGHDYGPLLLARRYIELQGANVLSDFNDHSFPNQGEGMLVEGTQYIFFRH